jgi:hypothetical protein
MGRPNRDVDRRYSIAIACRIVRVAIGSWGYESS